MCIASLDPLCIDSSFEVWVPFLGTIILDTIFLKFWVPSFLLNSHHRSHKGAEKRYKGILNARKLASELWSHVGYRLCHLHTLGSRDQIYM